MEIKRYITVQAVLTKENKLIPIWDKNIQFEGTELYGNVITLKDEWGYQRLVECIYDLKTKTLSMGVDLDDYPDETQLEFHKEDVVLFEIAHRQLSEAKIVDIVYEEFDVEIKRGSKMENWDISKFKDTNFEKNTLYAIKRWKPFYVLDNGTKIEWVHQLYKKVDNKK